jgi:hypothetical protein
MKNKERKRTDPESAEQRAKATTFQLTVSRCPIKTMSGVKRRKPNAERPEARRKGKGNKREQKGNHRNEGGKKKSKSHKNENGDGKGRKLEGN